MAANCNRVTAIELVTAGGEQIRVDAGNEPDLFWALRGLYLNFAEQPFELTKAFPPETVNRLREVKQRYDPDDLFHSNHPVTG